MNSKLFYAVSAELTKAEEEFNTALETWKQNKSPENTIAKEKAKLKMDEWQKMQNLLYLKS